MNSLIYETNESLEDVEDVDTNLYTEYAEYNEKSAAYKNDVSNRSKRR